MNEKLYTILDPYFSDQPPFFISIKRYFDFKPLLKKTVVFSVIKISGKEPFKSQSFISLEGPFNEYFLVVYQ